jgi:D-methionine transport system ATP-binding protein
MMSDRHSQSILRLEEVSLQATIGYDLLLKNISCDLQQGSKIGLIGASGAGKTSLLRLLNRLVSPSTGTIYIRDLPGQELAATQLRQLIALAPQEPKLLGMKVIDALGYPLYLQKLSKSEIKQRIDTWLDLLRIPESWLNKTELQLSLGQRQLVAIARALVMQPQVLLLDEPTSALDLGTATHLLNVLTELNQSQNLTIVMVNHQLELIKDFCDRLLFLNAGQLEDDLPANELNWKMLQQKILHSHIQQEQEWNY